MLPAISAHSNLLSDDPTAHGANIARLKGAIDLAVELAQGDLMPVVNTTSGYRSGRWDDIKDLLVERTTELVEYAQARSVTIAIEPHVGAAIDTPERMLQLLESVDSPYLMANLDISHFDVIGLSIEDAVARLAPYIANTHVKDQRGHVPDYEFLIPGEGDFDYVRYLKTMLAHEYEGFITVEISFMVQRRPDYDPFAAAKLSYQTLSQAFVEAGMPRK